MATATGIKDDDSYRRDKAKLMATTVRMKDDGNYCSDKKKK